MSGVKQFRAAVIIGYMLSITWLRRNLLSLVWLFATPFSLLFIITVTTGGRSFALGVVGSLLLVLSTVGTDWQEMLHGTDLRRSFKTFSSRARSTNSAIC